MSIPTRKIGKNGLEIPALGLGLMGLAPFYGPAKPEPECFALLDRAYELGIRHWDTSDAYGDNEDMLKKYFEKYPEKRANIFLATKFGIIRNEKGEGVIRGDPEYVREACERSLKRLGMHSIDLYYIHRIDVNVPIEKTVGALKELVDEGKVKYLGISECSATTLRRANKVHHIAAIQIEYSPITMDIDSNGLLEAARESGTAVVTYSPLGRGVFGGTIKSSDAFGKEDFRKALPRCQDEGLSDTLELVKLFEGVAKKKGCSVGQLTLAWVMAKGSDFFPIPGTTRISNLEENFKACKVKITAEEDAELTELAKNTKIRAARYDYTEFHAVTFADTPELEQA